MALVDAITQGMSGKKILGTEERHALVSGESLRALLEEIGIQVSDVGLDDKSLCREVLFQVILSCPNDIGIAILLGFVPEPDDLLLQLVRLLLSSKSWSQAELMSIFDIIRAPR